MATTKSTVTTSTSTTASKAPRASIVLDASTAIAFVFPDEKHNAEALALVADLGKRGVTICSPSLFESETDSVIRLRVAVKKLLLPEAEAVAFGVLDSLPVQIERDPATCQAVRLLARDIAIEFGRNRVYDSTYVALAKLRNAELWTADERLYNVVNGPDVPQGKRLTFVRFLGHFTAPIPTSNP